MIFKGGTLRVVSPVTEDGNRPKIDPETRLPIYKETFMPKSAKPALDKQNKRLPNHLKKKIELLPSDYVQPSQAVQEVAPVQSPVTRNKPGPKPKNHAQAN